MKKINKILYFVYLLMLQIVSFINFNSSHYPICAVTQPCTKSSILVLKYYSYKIQDNFFHTAIKPP